MLGFSHRFCLCGLPGKIKTSARRGGIWRELRLPTLIIIAGVLLIAGCTQSRGFRVIRQTVGFIRTNCYLLYDMNSGEAALIDAGGRIDTLESCIDENNLKLKYIFITHCHPDHVCGLPELKVKYPDARVCFSKLDFEDTRLYSQWMTALKPEEIAEIKENPEALELMNFDYGRNGPPDIYVEHNQIYKIGNLEIKAIFSPGHSSGSMCYYAGNALFSGDVLFYSTVGRTDLQGMSWEKIVESVRRLYSLLPDNTVVYPGHDQFTDIGSEKKYNKKVAIDGANRP